MHVPQPSKSFLVRHELTAWDAAGLAAAGWMLIAFLPPLMFDGWTPRMTMLLAIGPTGLYALGCLCRSRDWPAVVLSATLLWTFIAGSLSGSIRSAFVGSVGRDLSALIVALSAGAWAIGRFLSPAGRLWMPAVVVWGSTTGAIVGICQLLADVDTGSLAMLNGRPAAFATNPVYFGAISAAAMMIAVSSCADGRWRTYAAPLVLLGVATTVSGSRVALAAASLLCIAAPGLRRTRGALLASVAAIGSMGLGVAIDRVAGRGSNAVSRFGDSEGGRGAVWRYGVEATLDEPVFGYGFGRFRPAVQSRFGEAFVRDFAPEEVSQPWFDAHNAIVGVLVAVGIVGALMIAIWVIMNVRVARGPLMWALTAIVLHWMLQPVALVTLPLAMMLLGAAHPHVDGVARPRRKIAIATAAIGIAFAITLLSADIALRDAANDLDGDRAADVAKVFAGDPIVNDIVAQIYTVSSGADSEKYQSDVIEWRQRVAEAEPDRPYWWSLLAEKQIAAGRLEDADRSLAIAFELQPYNVRTSRTEARLAIAENDEERLEIALSRLCALGQLECDLTASELLASAQGR